MKFSRNFINIITKINLIRPTNSILLTTILFLVACQMNKNPDLPDISKVEVDLEISRFDKDLFGLDTSDLAINQDLNKIDRQYPLFLPFYHETLMEWNQPELNLEVNTQAIKEFIHHPDIRGVYDSVLAVYPDNAELEKQLLPAFKYFKYYFPDKPIPKIVAYLSAFRQQGLTLGENTLGLGLDMHLGRDYRFYETVNYPSYLKREFAPEYLGTHAMKVWAQQLYANPNKRNRLLDQMVFNGKLLYFLDLTLPEVHDSIKLGYTTEQTQWCEENEAQIWSFFIERKLLYESEKSKYSAFVSPGPTTMGMPKSSPGSVGNWLGLQIVRKYMSENPEEDFDTMFAEHDGQAFLKAAKYKPKKKN